MVLGNLKLEALIFSPLTTTKNMAPKTKKRERQSALPPPKMVRESSWDFSNPRDCADRIADELAREGWNDALYGSSPFTSPVTDEPTDLMETMMKPFTSIPYDPKRWNQIMHRLSERLPKETADFVLQFTVPEDYIK
jgi:hypothetical protein